MKKILIIAMLIFAIGNSAFAITPNENGIYEIANASQLEEFAAIVNSGQNTTNAVLTSNIDMNGVTHTPIGKSSNVPYKGVFIGRFH